MIALIARDGSEFSTPYDLYKQFILDAVSVLTREEGVEIIDLPSDEWDEKHISALEDAISDFGYTVEWADGYIIYGPDPE